jgi:hypothetical protein
LGWIREIEGDWTKVAHKHPSSKTPLEISQI